MGYLTEEERNIIRDLKEGGALRVFNKKEIGDITKNGGAAVFCGDGDIDVRQYHHKIISPRPHAVSYFGGVLIFARSFAGYDRWMAKGAMRNIQWGMEAKETRSVFLYPHYPCGVASKFGASLVGVINLAAEAHQAFAEDSYFDEENVHSFFHVKRINKDKKEEQDTYLFYPELL